MKQKKKKKIKFSPVAPKSYKKKKQTQNTVTFFLKNYFT